MRRNFLKAMLLSPVAVLLGSRGVAAPRPKTEASPTVRAWLPGCFVEMVDGGPIPLLTGEPYSIIHLSIQASNKDELMMKVGYLIGQARILYKNNSPNREGVGVFSYRSLGPTTARVCVATIPADMLKPEWVAANFGSVRL